MLRIALPNKGRLSDDTRDLFNDAGLEVRSSGERALTASLGGEFEAIFVRAQDIPEFVADGAADVGVTGWDLVMDPAMYRTEHWLWFVPDLGAAPAWVRFLGHDGYHGIPVANFLGWILTGTLVTRAMLAVIPPSTWARAVGPHAFPSVLYAANGILPILICLRWGMVSAGVVGLVAMGIPLGLAWRAPATAPRRARPTYWS